MRQLSDAMVEQTYKYDSGAKEFKELPTAVRTQLIAARRASVFLLPNQYSTSTIASQVVCDRAPRERLGAGAKPSALSPHPDGFVLYSTLETLATR